jgi:hypothetical protein
MWFTTFKEYVEMRDALRMLDKRALPIQARINPWPTTSAHRQKLVPRPSKPGIIMTPKPRPAP